MTKKNTNDEAGVLQLLIGSLSELNEEARVRILNSVATFFGISSPTRSTEASPISGPSRTVPHAQPDQQFSDHPVLSPKEFLLEKQPSTDVERVTCLAYYLTHYNDTQQFRTADITKLNTEAAQPQFSNSSLGMKNAVRTGYLVPAPRKRHRQLSAMGEMFVTALPDRDKARELVRRMGRRRKPVKKRTKKEPSTTG